MNADIYSLAYFLRIFAFSFDAHSTLFAAGYHLSETYPLGGDVVFSYHHPYSSIDDESMAIFTSAGISIA